MMTEDVPVEDEIVETAEVVAVEADLDSILRNKVEEVIRKM